MKTGGGPPPDKVAGSNPELDSFCNLDIKIKDTVDSDTLLLLENGGATTYSVVDDILIPEGVVGSDAATSSGVTPSRVRKERRSTNFFSEEGELRIEKTAYQTALEKELGAMRRKEQEMRNKYARQQLETAKNEEIFLKEKQRLELQFMKEKHELELQILRQKLSL